MSRWPCALVLTLVVSAGLFPRSGFAVSLEELDRGSAWRLGRLRITGNEAVRTSALRGVMLTETRPWYAVWRRRPIFDPVTLETDLERLARYYREHGYYHAHLAHDIEVPEHGRTVAVTLTIEEGPPVRVERVDIALAGADLDDDARSLLLEGMPIAAGQRFTEEAYNDAVAHLLGFYRERGYARTAVTRGAQVDVRADTAVVSYEVDSGPACVFGDIEVSGVEDIDPALVRREAAFRPGEPFRASRLDETRQNLTGLRLFRTISLLEGGEGERVDVRITVTEQPPREITAGVGFDTEELVRGFAGWRHFNFLGGGRQVSVSVQASALEQAISAGFLQPHFPRHDARTTLTFSQGRQDEDPFTLDRTRVSPRIDWRPRPPLGLFIAHRFEHDELRDVKNAISAAFPGIAPRDGLLSGVALGASWTTIDDPLEPSDGVAVTAGVEPVGDFLGGDFSFVRLTWEGRAYRRLVRRLVGSVSLRLGAADPVGSSREVPIFERFFAGGINSVRGYERWRIGPRIKNTPVGGRTRVEWSVELRQPFTERIAGVMFLDAGQVSVESYDFPFDDLRYGAGVGVRYRSPVGAIKLDLGFPTDPPGNDPPWQVHVSIGATY